MTDLVARRIPNAVVGPGYLVGAALLAVASAARGEWWPLERGGITLIVLSAFYFALRLAFPAGMGLGDVKWAGLVGLYIGWVRWEAASTATLVAFAGAALFIVARRVATSEQMEHDTLPMAPFIAAGALVAILGT